MLIENGAMDISVAEDRVRADISKSERSRTAVALTRSGQLMLAVVKELESAGYGGVTLEVLSELLLAEGAYTAMNLDGGGSSAIVVAGEVLNLAEAGQRAVSNVLVLALDESSIVTGSAAQAAVADTAAAMKYDRQDQSN
jgi:exopolysaccharide biosynthesis protein